MADSFVEILPRLAVEPCVARKIEEKLEWSS